MNAPRTGQVAAFARQVQWSDFPQDVQAHAVRCTLDLFGVALAGSRTKAAQVAGTYARSLHGGGAAAVIGVGVSSPLGAALANGFAVSALDMDDGYRPVKGHPGAVVFPAVLAAAQDRGCSGADFLTALVVAYEVAMRAGHILHALYDFYHGTGSWGPLGAAAGAARLLGCDIGRIWHALGIAEFHAAMTPEMRSVDHPSMLKDGIGWGSMVGLSSAYLAAFGFTGIPALFDADVPEATVAESLGQEYMIRGLYFKPYACCRWAQPAIAGALAAADELGVDAAQIARVRVHTFEEALHLQVAVPRSTEEAQFSLPWPVACALIDGSVGPEQVLEGALDDPVHQALANRVEMICDPEINSSFPGRALAWVEVETGDGQHARSPVLAARGDADDRLSDDELIQKFKGLVGPVLSVDRAEQLISVIRMLPDARSLEAVIDLLQPTAVPVVA